jgi:hypothetical protein
MFFFCYFLLISLVCSLSVSLPKVPLFNAAEANTASQVHLPCALSAPIHSIMYDCNVCILAARDDPKPDL